MSYSRAVTAFILIMLGTFSPLNASVWTILSLIAGCVGILTLVWDLRPAGTFGLVVAFGGLMFFLLGLSMPEIPDPLLPRDMLGSIGIMAMTSGIYLVMDAALSNRDTADTQQH